MIYYAAKLRKNEGNAKEKHPNRINLWKNDYLCSEISPKYVFDAPLTLTYSPTFLRCQTL